ncbi:MAG: hypothetical protein DCC71_10090 [Proteobacteria bacterium]|nr:MAG: hypothetical protein DCC71_10090 [Pseudomonadota bacterium]
MSWLAERARLEAIARAIEPSVRLVPKEGALWRALGALAAAATLGGIARQTFLRDYATAIGPLQGYPRDWSAARVEATLVHEARHTRQARWCGLGLHPWLGLPLFALLYLGLPLPAGIALPRFLFELDADRASWRHALAAGAAPDDVRARAAAFASRVCSGHYGWPIPRRLGAAWFARAADRTIAAHARARERTI